MEDRVTVTMKLTDSEVDMIVNSLENTIDSESAFEVIPKGYNTLLKDLKDIVKKIERKKSEAKVDRKLQAHFEEEERNGKKACNNCET